MNSDYHAVLQSSENDRRALFLETARRLGTAVQHVEKDFWVCWTLDVLFNGLPDHGPRLLFKGGTSLSKAYGLIDRFSEDVDITVFREDLGQAASIEDLEALSGKKRQVRLDAIKASCQTYIHGPLRESLHAVIERAMHEAGVPIGRARLVSDPSDVDGQTLLFWYPSVTTALDEYVQSAVKIESGAKSALDPHQSRSVVPYVATDVPRFDLSVHGVRTVNPERTFWDKVVILHGLRRWFDLRGHLRKGGQRVSRHYYDVFRLLSSDVGARAIPDQALAADCVRHARMFFNRVDLDLAHAVPGAFALTPSDAMQNTLRQDYLAMTGMIFGLIPVFDDIVTAIRQLENKLNA